VKTFFSTTEVDPRDRFEFWHDVACKNLVRHDSIPENRHAFQAELQAGALAEVGLVLFENTPMRISHTMRHAASSDADELFICRQGAGKLALEQSSRKVVLEAGDVTLLDPRLPYTGRFSPGSKLFVLKVPRGALEAKVGRTREITAQSIKLCGTENSLASAFLGMLPTYAGELGPAAAALVKDQALDLGGCIARQDDGKQAARFLRPVARPDERACGG
jgi:AraC family transcriptional regulator, positive regulator of tynA and feaB